MWQRFLIVLLFLMLTAPLAQAAPTTPPTDFVTNGDGTVTHKITGLTWKRCSEGQIWNSGSETCTGTAASYTWDQAMAVTSTFAGKNDWRVPTIAELVTIVERDNYNPAINTTIFPGTPATYFWSASAGNGVSFQLTFQNGSHFLASRQLSSHIKLVRGGQFRDPSSLYTPTSDFTDNNDGTVTHVKTSLTWKRCSEGQSWNGTSCSGSASTYTWLQATALTGAFAGKSDWRLPNLNELLTIVEWGKNNPPINETLFPGTPTSLFWSASSYPGNADWAWYLRFTSGYSDPYLKTDTYHARLVRGVQFPGVPVIGLTGLSLSCPTTLAASASSSCSVTASYSDGTSKSPSTSWTSSDSNLLSVGSSGSLTAGAPTADTSVTITASYSEGGMSKTATATVTVKAATAKLTGLAISGDATVKSGGSIALAAKGRYSDGTSHDVSATWSSSDTSSATVSSNGVVTAKTVTTDIPVTITASYTENGITQTAIWMISVKAVVPALTDVLISGSDTLEAGKTATYIAKAIYGDGSSKAVNTVIWSSSGSGATMDAQGVLTADAKLSADASVTLTATYTENGVSKTVQMKVTLKAAGVASACSGSGSNLSAITVAGNSVKSPGDSLEVSYCLKNYNSSTKFDVYVAVMLPDGTLLFMQSAGFFGTPSFTNKVVPYLSNTLIPDKSGPVLQLSVLPMDLPTGTYTFYAIPVFAGKDVMNGFNWVGTLASAKLNFMR